MKLTVTLLALTLAVAMATTLAAQDPPTRQRVTVTRAQEDSLLAAVDSIPRTVAELVMQAKLAEPVVRTAILRALERGEVRYRLVPTGIPGDTTATGRQRRQRAYYLAPTGEPRE